MEKVTIELTYNGFHGRNSFSLRVPPPEKLNDQYDRTTWILDLSPSQVARINRVVGCRSHKVVFGVSHPIEGACGCGEGINIDEPIYARKDGDNMYLINGHYPQQ
jgi:hypothetical protein